MGNNATKEIDESYTEHDSDDDFSDHQAIDLQANLEDGGIRKGETKPKTSVDDDNDAYNDDATLDDDRAAAKRLATHDSALLGEAPSNFRSAIDDDDDEIDNTLQYTQPSSDDEFDYEALEFFQTNEPNIYVVRRHKNPDSMFIVAEQSTPLVLYCRHMAVSENEFMRTIRHTNVATLPTNASDEQIRKHVPGILARVQREVLHEPVHFNVPLDDGSTARFRETSGDPLEKVNEFPVMSKKVAPIQILDPVDPHFETKLKAVERAVETGMEVNVFEKIDMQFKEDNLKQFTQVGTRLKFDEQPSDGFTETSPVEDENDTWLVVSMHYYYAWRAFEKTCEGNGNFLMALHTKLNTLSDSTYFFPRKIDGTERLIYTATQEHAVLNRALESYKLTLERESTIDNLYAQINNLAKAACAKLTDDNMRLMSAAIDKNTGEKNSDALKQISDAAALIRKLDSKLNELDSARSLRSFTVQ